MSARSIVRVSKDDPRVAPYTNVQERELALRDGRFIAEGANVVLVLMSNRSRYRPESLLVSEKREGLVPDLGVPEDVPVYSMKQDDMDSLVGFHIHRGVLALGARGKATTPEELLGARTDARGAVAGADAAPGAVAHDAARHAGENADVWVAMMGIVNHDNVGGIFRNAAAFGARGILMDDVTADPLYRKSIRVSVGGALITPFHRFSSAESMIQSLQNARIEILALSPQGETRLSDVRLSGPTAILLGPEGPGLPEEMLARLRTVRIPMLRSFDSLNVNVACAVALAALRGPAY